MNGFGSRIEDAVAGCGCDAVVAVGADNFQYMSGAVLPFAENYPDRRAAVILEKGGTGSVLCPFDWSEAIRDQGWQGEVSTYDENRAPPPLAFTGTLTDVLDSMGLAKATIGIDRSRVPVTLMDALRKGLPGVDWSPVDSLYRGLRIVKAPEEVALIEKAAQQLDRGIVHALNHLEGTVDTIGYTIAEFSERARVHICENGGSGIGHLSTTLGPDTRLYYKPQRGRFRSGEVFRIDASSHYEGYWANVGRMGVTGRATPEQAKSYGDNLKLKEYAVEMLKPGVACNEIFAGVKKEAEREGIPLWGDVGMGHGVGASHHEPPYITPANPEKLVEGMVLALDVCTLGPQGELIHSKDVYAIGGEGCRLLSWYMAWDGLYEVTGFRSSH
jgi:Xaa-Pro aminopeptidase